MDRVDCTRISHASARKLVQLCETFRFSERMYKVANTGPPGPDPWWIQLLYLAFIFSWISWIASMIFALSCATTSKIGCRDLILLLGVLNITVAIIVFFVCIYTFLTYALGGA